MSKDVKRLLRTVHVPYTVTDINCNIIADGKFCLLFVSTISSSGVGIIPSPMLIVIQSLMATSVFCLCVLFLLLALVLLGE